MLVSFGYESLGSTQGAYGLDCMYVKQPTSDHNQLLLV